MTTERVTDEDGHSFLVMRIHKGRTIPPSFVASGTERMRETPLRSDDIFLLSFPKAGCHWMWENIRFIMQGEIQSDGVEKDEYMMDLHEFGRFDNAPSPRILNNHAFFDDQPEDLFKGDAKVIFAYRNPKDTVVSFYHHIRSSYSFDYNGKFSAFLKLFVQGKGPYDFFEYMRSWQEAFKKHPEMPCMFINYENLQRKPMAERRRMAEFLGKERDDAFLQAVADATTMKKMREAKSSTSLTGKNGEMVMYRKGQIGDWKNYFTVSESEWFDQIVQEKLGSCDTYHFIYE